jgi:hypothetical protein
MQNEYGLQLIAINNEYRGLSYILINTALFMIPLLLLMKRWTLPAGTMSLFFGIVAALNSLLDGFRHYPVIFIAMLSGLATRCIVFSDLIATEYGRIGSLLRQFPLYYGAFITAGCM